MYYKIDIVLDLDYRCNIYQEDYLILKNPSLKEISNFVFNKMQTVDYVELITNGKLESLKVEELRENLKKMGYKNEQVG